MSTQATPRPLELPDLGEELRAAAAIYPEWVTERYLQVPENLRGEMANLAQLVNVIAPIMTEPGGPAWRQTTFYPFSITSRLASGEVIRPVIEAPAYKTARYGEASVIDAVATADEDRAAQHGHAPRPRHDRAQDDRQAQARAHPHAAGQRAVDRRGEQQRERFEVRTAYIRPTRDESCAAGDR